MTDEFSQVSSDTIACAPAAGPTAFQPAETVSVVRHPSVRLFDQAIDAIWPAVQTFALAKNIPLDEHEIKPVAIDAVKNVSRRTLRGVLRMDQAAIFRIQASISHSLDVLHLGKYITRVLMDQGYPQPHINDACAVAAQMLRDPFANDRTPTMSRWPDFDTMVRDHLVNAAAWDAKTRTLTLHNDAMRRILVRLPVNTAPVGS